MNVTAPPPGIFVDGCLPRRTRLGQDYLDSPILEDTAIKIIPESRWPELIPRMNSTAYHSYQIKSQKNEGSCASNMAGTAWQNTAHRQRFEIRNARGELCKDVRVSAVSLYKRVNGGRDGGSSIDENLAEIARRGILPETGQGFAHEFPATGWRTPFPSGWEETAKLFKITEWWDIATVEGFVTALLLGVPVAYGRSGHAIVAVCARLDDRGRLRIIYQNSWGQWGMSHAGHDYGFGEDSEGAFASWIARYGAWAPRVILMPQYLTAA